MFQKSWEEFCSNLHRSITTLCIGSQRYVWIIFFIFTFDHVRTELHFAGLEFPCTPWNTHAPNARACTIEYVYMHTHARAYEHTRKYTHVNVCTQIHARTWVCWHTNTCAYSHFRAHTQYTHTHAFTHIHSHAHTCSHVRT